jgi:hypothetical protein
MRDEALKLALDALERTGNIAGFAHEREQEAITAIKQALAAPVQEPVAWGVFEGGNLHDMFFTREEADNMAHLKGLHAEIRPLTTPPAAQPDIVKRAEEAFEAAAQRQWVGLTDEERDEICLGDEGIARAIEAKLKEKNT